MQEEAWSGQGGPSEGAQGARGAARGLERPGFLRRRGPRCCGKPGEAWEHVGVQGGLRITMPVPVHSGPSTVPVQASSCPEPTQCKSKADLVQGSSTGADQVQYRSSYWQQLLQVHFLLGKIGARRVTCGVVLDVVLRRVLWGSKM